MSTGYSSKITMLSCLLYNATSSTRGTANYSVISLYISNEINKCDNFSKFNKTVEIYKNSV